MYLLPITNSMNNSNIADITRDTLKAVIIGGTSSLITKEIVVLRVPTKRDAGTMTVELLIWSGRYDSTVLAMEKDPKDKIIRSIVDRSISITYFST